MKWILAKTEWESLVAVNTDQIKSIYVQDEPNCGTPSGRGYLLKVEVPMLDNPLNSEKAKMTTQVLDLVEEEADNDLIFMMFNTEEEANAKLIALVKKLNGGEKI